jgi:ACS family tartrate transporter-like MFS transporter
MLGNLESAVVTRLTLRLMPFLFLLYIVAYLDRINVGFAGLQMQQQLHFNDAVYGLGLSIFFAGYFFFQLPSNLILVRVGPRRWIAVIMVLWGIVSSSMLLVHTARGFYALRFLLGATEAGFFPGMILYLKTWFPASARARAVAFFMTAAPLSGVVGGPLSGAILGLHNLHGLAGWQWLFLLEGLPAIVLGGVVFLFLSDHPEQAAWLRDDERRWLVHHLELEHNTVAATQADWSRVFLSGRIWLLTIVYFSLNTCTYGVTLWLPKVIRSLSAMSDFRLGVLSSVPYIAAAITMVVVGLHSDRRGERRWHVAVSAFAGAAGLLAGASSGSLVWIVAGLSLAMMAVFSMMGPFWAIPSNFLTGTAAAAGIALINSVGNLGGFFGPYIIGLVRNSTGEFKGGLMIIGVALVLSGCAALLLPVEKVRPQADTP